MHDYRVPGIANTAVNNGLFTIVPKICLANLLSDSPHLCGIRTVRSGQSSDMFDLLKSIE